MQFQFRSQIIGQKLFDGVNRWDVGNLCDEPSAALDPFVKVDTPLAHEATALFQQARACKHSQPPTPEIVSVMRAKCQSEDSFPDHIRPLLRRRAVRLVWAMKEATN